MIEKVKRSLHIKDWNVYDKLDELAEQTNRLTNTLRKLLKQAGWEEENDKTLGSR